MMDSDALTMSLSTGSPWAALPPSPPLEPAPAPPPTAPGAGSPGGGSPTPPPPPPPGSGPRPPRPGRTLFASVLAGFLIAAGVAGASRLPLHGLRPTLEAAPLTSSSPAATAGRPSSVTTSAGAWRARDRHRYRDRAQPDDHRHRR